jgi:Zn-finger nucleic acid-binding protein
MLLKKRPAGLSIDELNRLRKHYQPLGSMDPVQYLPCPVCHEMMTRKNWGTYSGVIVDICQAHGTWFDDRELEKVQEYVLLGGIEYEKVAKPQDDLKRVEINLNHQVENLDNRILRARIMNFIFGK